MSFAHGDPAGEGAAAALPGESSRKAEAGPEVLAVPCRFRFWTILSAAFLLYSFFFSVQAPLGWWPNYLSGHEMWLDNDPGGWYLPSAHQLFATPGRMVFSGHPGLPMQIVLHVQQKLYFWFGGGWWSGLSFTQFTARHLPEVALGARLTATVTHLLSFYALFVFCFLTTRKTRAAYLSVLVYATSLPVLYFISRISVEPWMILFYLCAFISFWCFQSCMRAGELFRGCLWVSLAGFTAVSGALTKMHLLGPLPVFVFGMVLLASLYEVLSGSVTWRAGSAFVATYLLSSLISFLGYNALMDWSSFFSVWSEFLPGVDQSYTSVSGFFGKVLDVFAMLGDSLSRFSWSRLSPVPTRRNLFFHFEIYFLCLAALGVVLFLVRRPRGKALALWALLYSAFPVCMWVYRFQFHYLFTVVATLAVFAGYSMSEVIERLRWTPLGRAEWSIMLTAVLLLHHSGVRAVVESRITDLESARDRRSDVVARSLALVGEGERLAVAGDMNPYFHGLSASYARGVRSSLVEEVRRLYVRIPTTLDPTNLGHPDSVRVYGKIGLILDLRAADPRPVPPDGRIPPSRVGDGVERAVEEPAAGEALGEVRVVQREYVDADGRRWRANGDVDFRAEGVVLHPGGTLFLGLPTSALTATRFHLRAEARSLEDRRGVLRLQAAWLPAGGWQATDSTGRPIRQIEAERAYTDHTVQPHAFEVSRPDMAVRVAAFLHNDGDVPIEVLQVRLVGLDGP